LSSIDQLAEETLGRRIQTGVQLLNLLEQFRQASSDMPGERCEPLDQHDPFELRLTVRVGDCVQQFLLFLYLLGFRRREPFLASEQDSRVAQVIAVVL
jgi:hypothetical protein